MFSLWLNLESYPVCCVLCKVGLLHW